MSANNNAPSIIRTCQYKLVLLGEASVGKSSIVLRFVKGQFHEYQEPTIGAAFLTQTIQVDDTAAKFEIWDTAGQERYHSLAPMYYRGAQAAVVVYDLTNRDSFLKAQTWTNELQRLANPNIVICLCGNKLDMASMRQVTYEEAKEYAEQNGLLFVETSAKTGANVFDMFKLVGKKLPRSPLHDENQCYGDFSRQAENQPPNSINNQNLFCGCN